MKEEERRFSLGVMGSSDPSIQDELAARQSPEIGAWKRGVDLHAPTGVTEKPRLNSKVTKTISFSEKGYSNGGGERELHVKPGSPPTKRKSKNL